ncbi:TIGR03667 family PPOX class F420-dependent oxidoreductase [Isoptericola sp. BMS4]|uniref:TIGR03667 family PPOX class F420-dependent oxidoreductase n=1 Tax=Isoptericola sp. BMS4 TaxID=2527875 RepID=UPI001420D3ED|nr:TIGR03667 family PPOX class F420-dependent oxidoreductase [Isoptericola sp. BMS4]
MTATDPIDLTTRHGRRTAQRLRTEEVVWLTTVDPSGMPQPTPVWFLWRPGAPGEPGIGDVLLVSRPGTAKLRNVRQRPGVALHFGTDARGDDVVVLLGRARVEGEERLDADRRAEFDAKYATAMGRLGMTPEGFHDDYRVLVRVVPERLRGW